MTTSLDKEAPMTDARTFQLDKSNAKLMGVCSGLADYTGVDVTLVRIAAVLLTLFALGLAGPVIYLVAALIANDRPA
jgi:phage shock protein C